MLPANAAILCCPHCGGHKNVLQLMSGNTFGSTRWSDAKQQAPMLPMVSYIQRCPHCGKSVRLRGGRCYKHFVETFLRGKRILL